MMPAKMNDLNIVDPHFHLWDLEHGSYPWLNAEPPLDGIAGDITPIAQSYLLDDYVADQGRWKARQSVHVEAGYDPQNPVDETRWLQQIADKHGIPNGIVAAAALQEPDVEEILAEHCKYPNVRGIRQNLNWHKNPTKTVLDRPDMMSDSAWLAGFALLEKYDLSFDLQLYPLQLQDAGRLAARHPWTRIILNHAGMPIDRDDEGIALWHIGMKALAEQPNVSVKISGLGMMDWNWTTEAIRPYVLHTIEYFGVERCMFASNFPVDRLYSSFERLYDAFFEIVRDFSEDELRRLFGGTAVNIYRLGKSR
jgi:predicted TIM-barrel fold metal-dependent hydrolase